MVPSGHGEKTHGPAETLRMREGRVRKSERTRDRGEGIGGGERLGERDPMVEASNGGISKPGPGGGGEEKEEGPEVKEALSR